ncbi:MAG: response regulator [Firmicutes bacterium]|nr:response regulator [Bacillota bacterium]
MKPDKQTRGEILNFPQKKQSNSAVKKEKEKKKVLIVDDEPHMVKLLRLNLEPEGYEVLEAVDGEEACQLSMKTKPDLILLDVMVPKKNGIEVCKTIKGNNVTSHIPVILITARGEGMRKACLESGADLFLTKPFSPLRLLAEIRRMASKI